MSRRSSEKIYLAFYKPYGVLSQFSQENPTDRTLKDFFENISPDVYPVGRLDKDSEGLLFLTNDNVFKNKLLSPRSKFPKTYWAQLDGDITQEALTKLQNGVTIRVNKKNHLTQKAQAEKIFPETVPDRNPPIRYRKNIPTSWIELTITEGKNRQVRRMGAAVGFPVLRLLRVKIGKYNLDKLQPGEWVEIHPSHVY